MTAFGFLLAVAWLCVDWIVATMVDCADITGPIQRTVAPHPAWPDSAQPARHLTAVQVHREVTVARAQAASKRKPQPAFVMGQPGRWAA